MSVSSPSLRRGFFPYTFHGGRDESIAVLPDPHWTRLPDLRNVVRERNLLAAQGVPRSRCRRHHKYPPLNGRACWRLASFLPFEGIVMFITPPWAGLPPKSRRRCGGDSHLIDLVAKVNIYPQICSRLSTIMQNAIFRSRVS